MVKTTQNQLETDRLRLRPHTMDDLAAIHDYSRDREVTQYMQWGPNTEEQTRNFLELCVANQAVEPKINYEFAVTTKTDDRLIGSITLRRLKENSPLGEIGYVYAKDTWGKGFASEAALAILRYAFQQLGMTKISATCDPANFGSARVLQKAGMTLEGYLSKHIPMKGVMRDSLLYATTSDALEANLAALSFAPSVLAHHSTFAMGGEVQQAKVAAGTTFNTVSKSLDQLLVVTAGHLQYDGGTLNAGQTLKLPGTCKSITLKAPVDTDASLIVVSIGPT